MSTRLTTNETLPRWKMVLKWCLRLIVLILVVVGIGRAAQRARQDLASHEQQLEVELAALERQYAELDMRAGSGDERVALDRRRAELQRQRIVWTAVSWQGLVIAGLVYVVAGVPCWLFWHQTLHALGQFPTLTESLRAYFIGHLGKYVPGKALVVVLRTGLVRSSRVTAGVAVVSVFVETLTMMAVGAAVSAVLLALAWQRAEGRAWLPWAVGLMVAAALPTVPPFFRRIVERLQPGPSRSAMHERLRGLTMRLMAAGWLWMAVSWVGMGLSLWLTVAALPGDTRSLAQRLPDLPMMIACTALAVVLGFASLIPGGFGVRELVVTSVLAPLPFMGTARALGAAVLLRLVWLVAEVLLSIILYMAIRGPDLAESTAGSGGQALAAPPTLPGAS